MTEHGLTPSPLARQHGTFTLLLFLQVPPNALRKLSPFHASSVLCKTAKSSSLSSDRVHCLGKAGCEAVCLVVQRHRGLAGRTSSREWGRVLQVVPGMHCLHLGRYSADNCLAKTGRSRGGKSDADASGKAQMGLKQA